MQRPPSEDIGEGNIIGDSACDVLKGALNVSNIPFIFPFFLFTTSIYLYIFPYIYISMVLLPFGLFLAMLWSATRNLPHHHG